MAKEILQLRITLRYSDPPIWRRVLVPSDLSLAHLHDVIQRAMGWTDSHLHCFEIDGVPYGVPEQEMDDLAERMIHESGTRLEDVIARAGKRFIYLYDYGDNWEHEVVVEELISTDTERHPVLCVAGERACPPEDVGGVGGYEEFLEATTDTEHEDHEQFLDWIGGEFDPEEFDLEGVNAGLGRLAGRWQRRSRPG